MKLKNQVCIIWAVVNAMALAMTNASQAAAVSRQSQFLAFEAPARQLVERMTLSEKVGQMCQPDHAFLKEPGDIEKYFLGSLLSGGGSGPKNKADYTLKGWTDMVDSYQKHALKTRLAIPLLYGVDAVHGHNNIPGAVIFPHNIGLGCARNPELVERIARITAKEVRATGINWAFAPCVTVPQDIRWGRTYEGFSENPEIVKVLGEAATRGLQGKDLADPLSVVACAKHFIGDGGTAYGSALPKDGRWLDQGDTRCDEATLRRIHLQGYITTVNAGVATIMPSYSSWNGVKCSASKELLTDLLKKELGFEGFLISDYNALDQITPDYKKAIEISINAGMDMVMLTDKYATFCQMLKELVLEGKVPESRLDDAVTRILRVKFAAGLMDPKADLLADRTLYHNFGSAAHRLVARQAVRQSLVILKNQQGLLPLAKNTARIHVGGKGADDLGMQCGGWTTDWQGKMGNHIPGGSTILTGIKKTVAPRTQVTFAANGQNGKGAQVGIVVIGEKPYAEMKGDKDDLALDPEDVEVVKNMRSAGLPVVVVILSGRPILLDKIADHADAIVAAWLPGSEGQGVADVLFGNYRPTGKLSFAWPRAMSEITSKPGDAGYEPLYPLNHGLTY